MVTINEEQCEFIIAMLVDELGYLNQKRSKTEIEDLIEFDTFYGERINYINELIKHLNNK